MGSAKPASNWREVIDAGEAERHAGYGPVFAQLQEQRNQRYGKGRALHRKQLFVARAEFDVLPDLPTWAAQGLFAKPGKHPAWVRLSNGGMDKASDAQPDIRGFAFAVQGLQGPSALGNGPAGSQGFALINQSKFAFPQSGEFVDFVAAAARSKGALLGHMVRRYGLLAGPARLVAMIKNFAKPFAGFAHETFFSAAPIACGPYAVRVRLSPAGEHGKPRPEAVKDWGGDLALRLREAPLVWELALQPFTDEASTPIEDASVDWPSPYTVVARLVLPKQDVSDVQGQALAAQAEASTQFDPWSALADHRPLGEVMRARKVVYFQSQKGRGAA